MFYLFSLNNSSHQLFLCVCFVLWIRTLCIQCHIHAQQHDSPVQKVDVKDTLGAGDVWHGAFALGLAEGKNEIEAVKFANSAATIKCKSFGGRTGFPRRNEVDKFLKEKLS